MSDIQQPLDYGFFGPDSMTWKVFSYPTSFTVGFQRTVVTEMLEPFLLASVADTAAVTTRPRLRYDRTLQYVSTVAFADSATVIKASSTLMRIHTHIRGLEPVSGLPYDANAPQSQLWIHLTQWHSVLLAYELFGPGPLTVDEDLQYWAECRRAASFQTIDPDTVPRRRSEMREYYRQMRPRLAATEATQHHVAHLLDGREVLGASAPPALRPVTTAWSVLSAKATIASLPQWLRRLAGVQQSRAEDAAATSAMRAAMRTIAGVPGLDLSLLRRASPRTAAIVAPALLGVAPINPEVQTPEAAWAAAGLLAPRQQYEAALGTRVDQPAKAPTDPGPGRLLQFA